MNEAISEIDRCACWEPVYDVDDALPMLSERPAVRTVMCGDCAFRPDSPERNGDPRYGNSSPEELEEIVAGDAPFYCHKGMRRIVRFVHPTGAVYVPPTGFDPQIYNGGAYKANGRPADLCAGFVQARLDLAAEERATA